MGHNKRMRRFGVGPVYILLVLMITLVAAYIGKLDFLSAGVIPVMKAPMSVIGIAFAMVGIVLMVPAVVCLRMRRRSTEDRLITTGVYAWVRNPLYSAYSFLFSGILLLMNNLFLTIVPFIFWLLLSVIVRKEEAMLEKAFGPEYLAYKSRVNRCIPWFPKKP